MNSINTVTSLVILANSLDSGGPNSLPFPHAWAALIWFVITCVVFMAIVWPWTSWAAMIDQYPITQGQRERNAMYRRKIRLLLAGACLVSILGAVIPLMCGL
jgi:hypothetical protein